MFRELFRRLPDIEAAGEPELLQSSFIHGIKHLPARFTPAGPAPDRGPALPAGGRDGRARATRVTARR